MAPNAKSTLIDPQPQARISKSTKENATYQVQTCPQAPSAMKKFQATANGSRPLQTSQAPLQHAETAALLARIAAQDGQFFILFFKLQLYGLYLFSSNQSTNEKPSLQICRETFQGDSTPTKNHQPPTWYGSCWQQKIVFTLSSKSFFFFYRFVLIWYLWQATVWDVLGHANLQITTQWLVTSKPWRCIESCRSSK